ncbi:MAG: hypothetical protein B7Z63_05910, partial [Ignavibacteriae bacterium 37-53-5]
SAFENEFSLLQFSTEFKAKESFMSASAPSLAINGATQNTKATYTGELTVLTTLFFMWGFLTCLNDILIPHLKAVFLLNYAEAMLVQLSFFAAYFIVSLPSGTIVERIGYKRGIVIGLVTAGVGCLIFYPAAGMQSYPLFLLALFVLASGITLLQVAANPYVAILGKPETASSRLNLTQAFNSLGTTIAPYFGALVILSVAVKSTEEIQRMAPAQLSAYRLTQASAVQVPYLWLAAALLVIAAVFAFLKLPQIEAGSVAKHLLERGLAYHWRTSTISSRTPDEHVLMLSQLLTLVGLDVSRDVSALAISSSAPTVTTQLRRMTQRWFADRPVTILGPGVKTGMAILYDNPREVGADRIADAVGAYDLCPGPLIVVDLGTATVFDVVSVKGEYLGGAIAPGVMVSLEA